jgi:hypothetical protein
MSFAKKLAGGLLGMVLGIDKKPKKLPVATPPIVGPSRNIAAETAASSALLAKRRGVLANLVTGARGAEASVGSGTKMGN